MSKTYTLEEISELWLEFTQPMWILDNKKIDPSTLEPHSFYKCDDVNSARQLPIDYSRWIPFLISKGQNE